MLFAAGVFGFGTFVLPKRMTLLLLFLVLSLRATRILFFLAFLPIPLIFPTTNVASHTSLSSALHAIHIAPMKFAIDPANIVVGGNTVSASASTVKVCSAEDNDKDSGDDVLVSDLDIDCYRK